MPWLDGARAAQHLFLSEHRFLALVKSGKFPKPSYHLGARSPRWNSEALDTAMNPETPLDVTREAFSGMVKKIEEKGGSRRQAGTG